MRSNIKDNREKLEKEAEEKRQQKKEEQKRQAEEWEMKKKSIEQKVGQRTLQMEQGWRSPYVMRLEMLKKMAGIVNEEAEQHSDN